MAEFQRFRVAQGRHGGGTAMFGAFREVPTQVARPSPVLGDLGRSRTGPAAFRGGGGPKGATRRACDPQKGLLWPLMGLLRFPHGPRPAVGLQRSPARGARGWSRRRPPAISDNKTGGRCRKFWVGCLPSFSDTVHPGAYMEKPRRHCRGLVSSMVRRPSSFLGPPSRSRRAPSQPRSS